MVTLPLKTSPSFFRQFLTDKGLRLIYQIETNIAYASTRNSIGCLKQKHIFIMRRQIKKYSIFCVRELMCRIE